MQEKIAPHADCALLTTVFHIGQTLATVIVHETGTGERFASAGNFASYTRGVGSQRMSNSKKQGEGNTWNGNPYLCPAFIEAANFAIRFRAESRQFYESKKARKSPVITRKPWITGTKSNGTCSCRTRRETADVKTSTSFSGALIHMQ